MKQPDLSIIIVHYNTPDLTSACLRSIATSDTGSYSVETIVVDNGSTEHLRVPNRLRSTRVIRNDANLGFSAGNNIGIRASIGRYILLLNSDTEVQPQTIRYMIGFLDNHPEYEAATCLVQLPDGTMDPACHRGFPTPWSAISYYLSLERLFPRMRLFAGYHQLYKDLRTIHDVDAISGAFFFIRRSTIDRIGLLDEQFFMYGEDLDWAYRIRVIGGRIAFVPEVSILHRKKQSGRSHREAGIRKRSKQQFYDTMRIFYDKHYSRKYGFLVNWMVLSGIWAVSKLRD